MKFVLFYHSLVSDWNHGNAHFLRGVVRELRKLNHEVEIYEPQNGWSLNNLIATEGLTAIESFRSAFPGMTSILFDPECLDLDSTLADADVVIVHEWNDADLISRIGAGRKNGGRFLLLFHDTHHRSVSESQEIAGYDLRDYDGVLAFGKSIQEIYLKRDWAGRAWTWHEAADTELFKPLTNDSKTGDLVWIGNWGDGERTAELRQFLLQPIDKLKLKAEIYGVRYPENAIEEVTRSGAEYKGWLPNHMVPDIFSRFRLTLHIPRRPYVTALPGIPTIRVFEALACGIPLICAPWEDAESLFRPSLDYLIAHDTKEAVSLIRQVINDKDLAESLAHNGLETILKRHTCAHRVHELLRICANLRSEQFAGPATETSIVLQ